MKRTITLIVIAIMISTTALELSGCSTESLKSVVKNGADILESAYFYDEEKGTYEAVCILENNSSMPVKEAILEATAYDKDGNRIKSVKKDGIDYGFLMSYSWLSKGEKTAAVITNAGFENDEGMKMMDQYTEVPVSLEWAAAQGMTKKESNMVPHGLSIKSCELDTAKDGWYGEDTSVYSVTLRNDSETDYVYNEDDMCFQADTTLLSFEVVAVYRDPEGNIKDVECIQDAGINTPDVIPAGSETVMEMHSLYRCKDDSLTPEYYLYIDSMYEE